MRPTPIASKTTTSLREYRDHWQEAGLSSKAARALAQLSYENQSLRDRLANVEAIMLAWTLGMVEIDDDMHLLECGRRTKPGGDCTCGSSQDDALERRRWRALRRG